MIMSEKFWHKKKLCSLDLPRMRIQPEGGEEEEEAGKDRKKEEGEANGTRRVERRGRGSGRERWLWDLLKAWSWQGETTFQDPQILIMHKCMFALPPLSSSSPSLYSPFSSFSSSSSPSSFSSFSSPSPPSSSS
jgi:hypothetical protein